MGGGYMSAGQGSFGPMTHIGHRIHQLRKERGLRLSDVAQDIVSVGYLSMIEQGQRTPSSQVLRALAARLDVDQAVLESGSFASARLADVIELQEAMWQHIIGDYPDAIRRYRNLLQRGSTVASEATRGLARSLLRSGDAKAALHVSRRRVAGLITDGDWATQSGNSLLIGLCLLQLGDLEAAHEHLQAAVDVATTHGRGTDLHATSLVYLGRCQLRRGLISPAVASFEAFLNNPAALRPMQPLAATALHWWALGEDQIMSSDLVGAIRTRERALALQSVVAVASVKLRMAVECVGYLVRSRTPETLAMAGHTAHQLRSLPVADVEPRFRSDLLLVSAEVALAMHAPHEALMFVDDAVQASKSPDIAWAEMIRALASETLSDLDAALEHADLARAQVGKHVAQGHSADEVTEPWEVLAALYRRLGQEDIAWDCMRNAAAGAGVYSSFFPQPRRAVQEPELPAQQEISVRA